MKSNKPLLIIIFFLLTINAVAIYFLLQPKDRHPFHRHHGPPSLVNIIDFPASVKDSVTILEREHFRKKNTFHRKNQQLKKQLYKAYTNNSSAQKIDSILQKIGRNQIEIEKITFQFFNRIRKMGDEKIMKKMDAFVLNKVIRHPHPPGPPPR